MMSYRNWNLDQALRGFTPDIVLLPAAQINLLSNLGRKVNGPGVETSNDPPPRYL